MAIKFHSTSFHRVNKGVHMSMLNGVGWECRLVCSRCKEKMKITTLSYSVYQLFRAD